MRDDLFQDKITKSFEFDENVAQVFDDMLARSIPFYKQTLALCVSLCEQNTKENDVVYDIGCSTGNLLIHTQNYVGTGLLPLKYVCKTVYVFLLTWYYRLNHKLLNHN